MTLPMQHCLGAQIWNIGRFPAQDARIWDSAPYKLYPTKLLLKCLVQIYIYIYFFWIDD